MDTLLPFDLAACQVDPSTLAALRAIHADSGTLFSRRLLSAWINHLPVGEAEALADDFLLLLATFPGSLTDPDWQAELLKRWQALANAGQSPDWLFILCNHSFDFFFADLSTDGLQLGRMQAELYAALRRALLGICTTLLRAHPLLSAPQWLHGPSVHEADANILALDRLLADSDSNAPREAAFLILGLANASLFRHLDAEWSQRLGVLIVRAISAVLREYDYVFILHGSRGPNGHEWGILLRDFFSTGQVHLAALRIRQELLKQGSHLLGGMPPLQPVFGAALFPEHGQSAPRLLQTAGLALSVARQQQSLCEVFTPKMESDAAEQMHLASLLAEALDNDRLNLYFQPQVDLRTGKPVGVEALLRWQLPTGRFIPPPAILELVESQNLRVPFNRWLFHSVLRSLEAFHKAGLGFIHVSFNLTATDLLDDSLPEIFARELQLWGLSADNLTIELTEGALISDFSQAAAIMNRLRQHGFTLAMDDFGTGFSSLSYLRNLPLSELKIDRMFVYQMIESARDREIVQSTIDLAHKLGMLVVAEGMEDHATARLLGKMGCDWAQGYAMSPPLNLDACLHWCQHWNEYEPGEPDLDGLARTVPELPILPTP